MRPLFLLLLLSSMAHSQEFEVASIKSTSIPAGPISAGMFGTRGGPGTDDPTHITSNLQSLRSVVLTAFGLKAYQLGAPDWLGSTLFNFSVVLPEGATKEQVPIMWQNLLISRFGLKTHMEQKEFPSDELVVGSRGHKLKESLEEAPPPPAPGATPTPTRFEFDPDGRPTLPGPGLLTLLRGGPTGVSAYTVGRAQTMPALAGLLEGQLGHPVTDKTGLTGKYDFSVEFAPPSALARPSDPSALPADPGVNLGEAVQQQLGLRLEKGKTMRPYLVIDAIEKLPTEN